MKNYIKGVVVFALACGMSAVGEEEWDNKPDLDTKSVAVTKSSTAQKDFSIRISLGSAPGVDEWEGGGSTDPVDEDGGGRLEVLAVKRFWSQNNPNMGWTFGGGLFLGGNSGTEIGGTDIVEISAFGGMIQGGFAAKIGNAVVVELTPYVGLGGAENETTGFSSGNGLYLLYGIKGGAFVALGNSFELGLEVGYEGFSQEQEYKDGFGETVDVTWSGSGSHVALVAAIKF